MAYDALAESLRLIETGTLAPRASLSRSCRHLAMAVDVAGNYAVTMFARRSVGRTVIDSWVLARRDGSWSMICGETGSNAAEHRLQYRPARLDVGLPPELGLSSHIATSHTGMARDTGVRSVFRPTGRWVYFTSVKVSAEVATVSISGRQVIVPWHGEVPFVWTGRRPQIEARAEDGTLLGQDRPCAP
ncbi:hypothetical protein [Litorihabitans aurantiacus]|uniref:Uncharacterized protein n=1 Tax=Litorihabitans aurantiacus TaxID=1930061 RepID=A0AA37USS8_9MICO|nr:hypothetical protein [Litorihabitans aurantiacus]GMA30725.1 hypothetical protein GCM10025875_07170 [Litorihabitans aurantiacus]